MTNTLHSWRCPGACQFAGGGCLIESKSSTKRLGACLQVVVVADGDRLSVSPQAAVLPVLAQVSTAKQREIVFQVALDSWAAEPPQHPQQQAAVNPFAVMMGTARSTAHQRHLPPDKAGGSGKDRLFDQVCADGVLAAHNPLLKAGAYCR